MKITRMIPMLSFQDVDKALGFYRDLLGFDVTAEFGDGARTIWCTVKAGSTEAMLQYHPRQTEKSGGTIMWIYTDDVDALHAELKAAGWKVSEPETEDGRREFETVDTEGHPLIFCQVMD